jgi:hypothetical protein
MTGGARPSATAAGARALGIAGLEAGWTAASGGRQSGWRGNPREHDRTSAVWARNQNGPEVGRGEEELKEKDFHFEKHSNN